VLRQRFHFFGTLSYVGVRLGAHSCANLQNVLRDRTWAWGTLRTELGSARRPRQRPDRAPLVRDNCPQSFTAEHEAAAADGTEP
jgi:hypothetical protein